jgi:hypothetical protein
LKDLKEMERRIRDALVALVPMRIAELRSTTFEQRKKLSEGITDIIASQADQLMFASHKSPGVLPKLVTGVAVLAYQPGGVTTLGFHACVYPHPGCPLDEGRPRCCQCEDKTCDWCRNGCRFGRDLCCIPVPPFGRSGVVEEES